MQRLWLRWLVLALFLAVVAVAFTSLGRWQLSRLEERRLGNEQVAAQQQAPPVTADRALADEVTDAEQWQRVEVDGVFETEQLAVPHRRNGGEPGYEVLTPLRLADGRHLLVSRGFVPLAQGLPVPSSLPSPPHGTVQVAAWLRRNEVGRASLITPAAGSVRLVDVPSVAATLPYPVVPTGWLAAYEVRPDQEGLEPVVAPTPEEGNHFSYALQWFAFTGIAVVGAVVLVRGDLRDRRQARTVAAGAAPAD